MTRRSQSHHEKDAVVYVHPEAVAQAQTALPDEDCTARATGFLKLLGDPTRLRLLSALSQSPLCVRDLAATVGISESAASHQLRLLRVARLVKYHKVGRVAYYALLDEHVTVMIESALHHAREG